MAELNGDAPVEGRYVKHLETILGDSDDDSDDDDDSVSNIHESVSDVAFFQLWQQLTVLPVHIHGRHHS